MRERSGEITVFFAVCLVSIIALLLALFESARTAGARLYFTQAADSAIESLCSQYHRGLWESYRLLGLEHYSERQLTDEFEAFIDPYFEVKDWYPLRLSESPSVVELTKLTDNEGEIYEKQVLEYMKYGLIEELWDISFGESLLADLGEALELKKMKLVYEGHSKEASRLEESLERLDEKLKEQEESYDSALKKVRSLNGRSLIRELKKLKKRLMEVPQRVEDYEKKADALAEKLEESQKEFDAGKAALSDKVRARMEAETSEYKSYVAKDGERRREISSLKERAEENAAFVERVIEVAEEVLEYIESWEPSDEDDELDEEALWRPVRRLLARYDLLSLNVSFGVADKEKEGFLENVGSLLGGDILKLVLPEGTEISKEELDLESAPSATCFSGYDGSRLGIIERLTVTEYALKEFNYYGRDKYGDDPEKKGSGRAELEYIFAGGKSDYENLSDTVMTLILIREGMNLIYLFSDQQMREEAKALAAVITGVTGFPPLISVMTFFILGMWALGQAIYDLRVLMAGGKVPIMHTRESWKLDKDGLLELGRTRDPGSFGKQDTGTGLSYKDWMRVLIFKDMGTRSDYRSMDMIQMNLRLSQKDFLLKRCASDLELKVKADAGRVMFSGSKGKTYSISSEPFYSY